MVCRWCATRLRPNTIYCEGCGFRVAQVPAKAKRSGLNRPGPSPPRRTTPYSVPVQTMLSGERGYRERPRRKPPLLPAPALEVIETDSSGSVAPGRLRESFDGWRSGVTLRLTDHGTLIALGIAGWSAVAAFALMSMGTLWVTVLIWFVVMAVAAWLGRRFEHTLWVDGSGVCFDECRLPWSRIQRVHVGAAPQLPDGTGLVRFEVRAVELVWYGSMTLPREHVLLSSLTFDEAAYVARVVCQGPPGWAARLS